MINPGKLSVSALTMRFKEQDSLLFQIENLQIDAGKSVGIYGSSGAGKTTLLHCLSGIERAPQESAKNPAKASIVWGGVDICALSSAENDRWRRQNIGLVFQDFYLLDGLSALDNVLLPHFFANTCVSAAMKSQALALLKKVDFPDVHRRAELLSRGERQRVAVARALLFHPPIILADEPTASLDPANREIIGELLLSLVREYQSTLIMVSHETRLLERLDYCMELKNGRLSEKGSFHV